MSAAPAVMTQSPAELRRVRLRNFSIVTVLIALLIAGMAVIFISGVEDRLVAKRFGVVVPESLFRSGQISTFMFEPTLKTYGITAVIDLSGYDPDDPLQRHEVETIQRMGVEQHRFKLDGDGRGNIETYVQVLETIEECRRRDRRVLVHCAAGTQRTGGIVAMYRLLVQHESPATAVNEMRRYGWRPTDDVVLLDYLNDNMATLAQRLHEEGVIDRVPDVLPVLSADFR